MACIMNHISWSSVPAEDISPQIRRQYVSQPGVTVAKFHLKKGGVVPMHQHHNVQVTNILTGKLKFFFKDGREQVIGPGESLYLAPNEPHEAHCLEDCDVLDVFMPEREDWANKTDDYFRR